MKNNIKILTFIPKDIKIGELFENDYDIRYVNTHHELEEQLNICDCISPRIVIIYIDYILNKENDLMYKNASIVVYGKDIPLKIRDKLYSLDVKGIIDENNTNKSEIFSHIKRRSNIYASSFKNNSAKAITEYYNVDNETKKLVYLLDYIIYLYKISDTDASDIHLVLISLIVAFKEDKVIKTAKFLNTIFKSQSINKLYQNYSKPKTFNEKIIAILLGLSKTQRTIQYVKQINYKYVEAKLTQDIQQIYKNKNIAVVSYQDINHLWEQLYLVILDEYPNLKLDIFDIFLTTLYNIVVKFLIYVNCFLCSYEFFNSEKIVMDFQFIGKTSEVVKNYIDTILDSISNFDIIFDTDDNTKIRLIYIIEAKKIEKITKKLDSDLIIDTSNIDKMHYEDNKKISAAQFLQDFEVDRYMLDDLSDNAQDIKDLLYKEDTISQTTLNAIVDVLNKYAVVIHETVEFEDVAYSIENLSTLFANLSIDEINKEKKGMLSFYIQGLVDDLDHWKNYIFIDANAPDIHYLDASLLENCATIEKFIVSKEDDNIEGEEDDLEFF